MTEFINWVEGWTGGGKYAIIMFPFLAAILLYFSLKIVKYAEVIIAKSKFGAGFVGGTLVAVVTSMPELITEVSQALAGHPENGLGDDIGSNAFSIFLIGVAGLIFFRYLFLNKLSTWTKITIGISLLFSLALTVSLMIGNDVALGSMGIIPLLFFLAFLTTIFLNWKFGDNDGEEEDAVPKYVKSISLRKGTILFTLNGLGVVLFSVLVNVSVTAFQEGFNIPSASIGGVFLAMTTSLPEVVAFVVFLRKQQPGAAIASLVGSHFFNLGILFFGDLAFSDGPTFQVAEMQDHLGLAALTASMLFVLVIHFTISIKFKHLYEKKWLYMITPSLMVAGYIVGWILILSL